ncbi:class I SAM-dependent methyltransferase [Pseudomonas sp. RIT-PI-S]|uniref:class I SAM-dependent methyltransferase n=1 Tax=Pseudomonas sp. RIT-PI-S TaxID=3035295 RepID=UPI0021D81E38|nr:class I SAM-dependent methyltransferase [Pseudomonas sp. RIT-PI-S]
MHQAAELGFSIEAATYTTGRPDYPEALKAWLATVLDIGRASTVIDLGAGTGKLTRLIDPAAQVTAVEPVAAMRAEFAKQLPGIRVLEGKAEAIPFDSSAADALVCGQAFHWFANDAALREIHRVLKPQGRLGLVWNVRDEAVEWVAEITQIITPYEGDAPRLHTGQWQQPFDNGLFSEPELSCFAYSHVGSPQAVIVDRFLSVSFIAALPTDEKCIVAERLRELISDHPALRGREVVAFPYQTQAYAFQRL